jgi:hypothetical protein
MKSIFLFQSKGNKQLMQRAVWGRMLEFCGFCCPSFSDTHGSSCVILQVLVHARTVCLCTCKEETCQDTCGPRTSCFSWLALAQPLQHKVCTRTAVRSTTKSNTVGCLPERGINRKVLRRVHYNSCARQAECCISGPRRCRQVLEAAI